MPLANRSRVAFKSDCLPFNQHPVLAGRPRLDAPLPSVLHEPVDEPTPVIDDLTVYQDLGVLNTGDECGTGAEVDLELLESYEHDLAGNLFDPRYERVDVHSGPAVGAVNKIQARAVLEWPPRRGARSRLQSFPPLR